MKQWETAIDVAIRKAMEAGEFNNLPGEGQPIDLSADANVPSDMQLAYKIMRENGIAPDWIVQGKALTAKTESWQSRLTNAHKSYRTSQNIEAWLTTREKLALDAEKLNKEIVSFNLKLPPGLAHRPLINFQKAIERLSSG